MPGTPFSQFPGTVEQFLGFSGGQAPAQAAPEQQQPAPQPQPAARQRPQRRRRRRKQRAQPKPSVAEMFFGKLQSGSASAGPGIIPYSVLPEQVRRGIPLNQPPVGWDPRQLNKRERRFAFNLVQKSDTVDEERRQMMLSSLMQAQQEADELAAIRKDTEVRLGKIRMSKKRKRKS